MPKPSVIKAKYEAQRIARQKAYGLEIKKYFEDAIDEAMAFGEGVSFGKGVFDLKKYPYLNARVDKIVADLSSKISISLYGRITSEWQQSDLDNDALFRSVLKPKVLNSPLLNARNDDALRAFLQRKVKGLDLSKRVVTNVAGLRRELEAGLADMIYYGKGAKAAASDLKKYMAEPDMLFRRIKKDGKFKLSKRAMNYHPGQGVYRSSYKNALRITRTETNMAYRRADHERYQSSPFIIGYEVRLSLRHPDIDICDDLKGRYPKTFVFIGWHPQCLCYAVPIFLTPEEYDQMERDLLAGKDVTKITYSSVAAPTGEQAKVWYVKNKARVDGWQAQPYFMKDNPGFFK